MWMMIAVFLFNATIPRVVLNVELRKRNCRTPFVSKVLPPHGGLRQSQLFARKGKQDKVMLIILSGVEEGERECRLSP